MCGHTGEGEGGMNWESSTDIYSLPCVKQNLVGKLTAQYSENSDHGIWSHHFMANRWGDSGNSD